MKVWRVGPYYTSKGREYAETMRALLSLSADPDPFEPVELEMTPEQWAALEPTGINVSDIQP